MATSERTVRAPAVAAPAAATVAAGATGPASTSSTRLTTSESVRACRSDTTKSGRTRARARPDSSFMCSAPADCGAAIRKTRSAGPSAAPKSTRGRNRANAMDASCTAADRQCGMAIPPGNPVADWASRASAASSRDAPSSARPASATRPANRRITVSLSEPRSASSRTRSVPMTGIAGGFAGGFSGGFAGGLFIAHLRVGYRRGLGRRL